MRAKNEDYIGICDRFLSPEESLVVALIENAIIDAFLPPPNRKKRFVDIKIEALRWLFCDDSVAVPWTLGWCFDVLDLDIADRVPIIVRILKFRLSLNLKKGDKKNGKMKLKS